MKNLHKMYCCVVLIPSRLPFLRDSLNKDPTAGEFASFLKLPSPEAVVKQSVCYTVTFVFLSPPNVSSVVFSFSSVQNCEVDQFSCIPHHAHTLIIPIVDRVRAR